ncbi:MAG: SMP-30/gluconolactonase/LRE family protein [bacterium]
MMLRSENVQLIEGLDHPECVCVGPDGSLYAGGEDGQLDRFTAEGERIRVGCTEGFLLGIAIDGRGRVHACDLARKAVVRIDPNGAIIQRSNGPADRRLEVPNYPVFDVEGRLFVSDSGDYWSRTGTGRILVVEPDNTTRTFHAGPFRFANGLAVSPDGCWLYIAQSTASDVVRVALDRADGPIERTHRLPDSSVPDGLAFTHDGRLLIACYKPDAIFLGERDGTVRLLHEDPTGELLNRPTNVALHEGQLYVANLGGWHITRIATDLQPGPVQRPQLP